MRSFRSLRRAALAATVLAGSLAACGDDGGITGLPSLAGTYTATTFLVTPDTEPEVDVLAAGGSLTITIDAGNATSGTLNVPASVTGDVALDASMVGTAERTGSSVSFTQTADTFVRDLNWVLEDNTIRVTNQSVGGARFTIVLTR